MLKFIYKIKKKKFDFFLPQKSTFLIFDTYSNTVEKYKGNELFHELIGNYPYSVFDITGSVNVLILLKSILTNFSRIPLTEFYIKTYIESVSPKCVITNVDNNLLFYKIKNLVDYKITTISIQNGLGDKSALKNLKENEGCDYIFTFSDSYSNIFLKYIKNAKCITIGSLKNNIYNKRTMSIATEYSRLVFKRSTLPGVTPTIPTASTIDNTWLSTDLLVGEMFANVADDRLWFRSDNGIMEISLTGETYTND